MSTTDNFVPLNYYDISSEIEKAVKSSSHINPKIKESAWLRSAVSRAYYAAFLTLREEFKQNTKLSKLIINQTSDHQTIIDTLYTLPKQDLHFANSLSTLRKNRNDSDYKLPPTFKVTSGVVTISNLIAKKIIQSKNKIINNIP